MTLEFEAESKALAEALNTQGYPFISAADVHTWLDGDGGGDADKVDEAAKKILGEHTYAYFDCAARLWNALEYAVGLNVKQYCGGINLAYKDPRDV